MSEERKPGAPLDIKGAAQVVAALEAAGISEDDPDFRELFDNESDVLVRLRKMAWAVKFLKAEAEGLEALAKKTAASAKRRVESAERLREGIAGAMDVLGLRTLPGREKPTVYFAEGREGVTITDEDAIPRAYLRTVTTPDKTAILEALQAGKAVKGAALRNPQPVLNIR
jgi:hypothetical protein